MVIKQMNKILSLAWLTIVVAGWVVMIIIGFTVFSLMTLIHGKQHW